jgi:hypothetical protein
MKAQSMMTVGTVSVISWNYPQKRIKNTTYHALSNVVQALAPYLQKVQKHQNQENPQQKRQKNQSKRKVNFYLEPMKSSCLSAWLS